MTGPHGLSRSDRPEPTRRPSASLGMTGQHGLSRSSDCRQLQGRGTRHEVRIHGEEASHLGQGRLQSRPRVGGFLGGLAEGLGFVGFLLVPGVVEGVILVQAGLKEP